MTVSVGTTREPPPNPDGGEHHLVAERTGAAAKETETDEKIRKHAKRNTITRFID